MRFSLSLDLTQSKISHSQPYRDAITSTIPHPSQCHK